MNIKIYHNPRCSKSREGLAILQNTGSNFGIVKYLDTPLSKTELKDIIHKLHIRPIDLVRKNETIWKENFKERPLNDHEIIQAMAKYPKLIERPIVVKGNKAVIGRPPSLIKEFLEE